MRDSLAIVGFLGITNYWRLLSRWTCCLCTVGQVVDTRPESQPDQGVTSPDPNSTPSVTPPDSGGESQNSVAGRIINNGSKICVIMWEDGDTFIRLMSDVKNARPLIVLEVAWSRGDAQHMILTIDCTNPFWYICGCLSPIRRNPIRRKNRTPYLQLHI